MTKHDPQTRYWAGTRGVGVSWRPRRRPWVQAFFAGILFFACVVAITHAI
jgi:hypothetical protein